MRFMKFLRIIPITICVIIGLGACALPASKKDGSNEASVRRIIGAEYELAPISIPALHMLVLHTYNMEKMLVELMREKSGDEEFLRWVDHVESTITMSAQASFAKLIEYQKIMDGADSWMYIYLVDDEDSDDSGIMILSNGSVLLKESWVIPSTWDAIRREVPDDLEVDGR